MFLWQAVSKMGHRDLEMLTSVEDWETVSRTHGRPRWYSYVHWDVYGSLIRETYEVPAHRRILQLTIRHEGGNRIKLRKATVLIWRYWCYGWFCYVLSYSLAIRLEAWNAECSLYGDAEARECRPLQKDDWHSEVSIGHSRTSGVLGYRYSSTVVDAAFLYSGDSLHAYREPL